MASDASPQYPSSAGDALLPEVDATSASVPAMQRHAKVRPRFSTWVIGSLQFVWFFLLALIVQWPYRAAYHVLDDRYLQFLVGLLKTDRISWGHYLYRPLEGHFVPVWKLIYFLQWEWFGENVWPWHMNITMVHTITAFLLCWLLTRYLKSSKAALFGATIWAAAAIGRWDNPLAWLATGQIPWSFLWLLLAMVCQSKAIETGKRGWLFSVVASLAMAVLTWGAILALSIVLPLQLLLVEPVHGSKVSRRKMLFVWGGTFVALACVTLAVLLPHMAASDTDRSVPDLAEVASRLTAQMSVTFGAIAGWGYTSDPLQGLAGKRVAAGIVLLVVALLPWSNRRVLALFLGLAFVHLVLVDVFRANVGFEAAVGWGRYLYFATFAWGVVAAVGLDALLRLTRSRWAWGFVVVATVFVPFYVVHQRSIAGDTMEDFFVFYNDEHEHFLRQSSMVEWLNEYAQSQDLTLVVPDIPLEIRPTKEIYFPLSAFVALVAPEGLSNLEIATGRAMVDVDLDADSAMIARSDSPLAPQWQDNLRGTVDLVKHLLWLSSVAESSGTTFRIPDRMLLLNNVSFSMSHLLGMNFPEGLSGVQIHPGEEAGPEVFETELQVLENQSGDSALWWEKVYWEPKAVVVMPE